MTVFMNLYIVATPIGNLQDITLRAAKILLTTRIIIAESTSKAGILLEFLKKEFPDIPNVPKQIISLTEDEEEIKIPQVIKILENKDAALISEAGTPLISDPGFKLVREAIKHGVNIVPIPGPTAAITALVVSGLPPSNFWFLGYLPNKIGQKEKILGKLVAILSSIDTKCLKPTVIIYESPHRLVESLKAIQNVFGNIDIVIARELTKVHEEFLRGTAEEILGKLETRGLKGEITLLFRLSD